MDNINVVQRSSIAESLPNLAFHNIYKTIYDLDQLDFPPETNLAGTIKVKNAYQYAVDYLENKYYPDLEIEISGDEYYEFEDPNTEIGVANTWSDKVGITLRSMQNLNSWPSSNTLKNSVGWKDAVTFNEFSLFTRMYSCTKKQFFREMPNLEEIDISHMTQVSEEFLWKCLKLRKIGATDDNVLPNLQHIGANAFNYCELLTTVSIPNFGDANFPTCFWHCPGLETAHVDGRYMTSMSASFGECTSLTSVTGLSNVTKYGKQAFYNCSNLTHIDNLANIKEAGDQAFQGCSVLEGFDLSNLETISGTQAFRECLGLTTANLASIRSWNYWGAFYGCTNLSSVTLNPEFTDYTLYGSTFRGCTSLTSIDLTNCKELKDFVFAYCSSLSNLGDTSNIQRIDGNECFRGSGPIENFDCTSLSKIPNTTFFDSGIKRISNTENITNIGADSFVGSGLLSASFPNLTIMGSQAFRRCPNLVSLDIGLVDKVNVNNQQETFRDCTSLTSFTANELTYLGYNDFYNCTSLTTLVMPKLETIGTWCFNSCSSLTNVSLPEVKTIGDCAFKGCASLTNVEFPKCESVGTEAFREDNNLANINMPLCTSISNSAFYNCKNLVSVSMPSLTTIGNSSFDWCQNFIGVFNFPNVTSIGQWAFSNCQSVTSITLGTLSLIPIGAFNQCYAARTISFTSAANLEIQYEAFKSDTALTSIDLSNLKTFNGNHIFSDCSSLTTVVSLGNLESCKKYDNNHGAWSHFKGCIRLTTAPISNKLTSMPNSFFEECNAMVNVGDTTGLTYVGEMAFYNCGASTLQGAQDFSHVTEIGGQAFQKSGIGPNCNFSSLTTCNKRGTTYSNFSGCNKLVSINVSSLLIVPNSCFSDCANLETVTLGAATRIESWAFYRCSKLNNLTLPASVTYIGDRVFEGCSGLKTLIVMATTPPETHQYALNSMPSDLIIYVPNASVSAYLSAARWSSKNIQPISSL